MLFLKRFFWFIFPAASWFLLIAYGLKSTSDRQTYRSVQLCGVFCCFVISDQQHFVLCFAAHINVFIPPVCNPFQQWDLPHMDSAGCGW